jgi:heptosyltransferase-1
LSAIGDVLMASPLPQALREAYPRAHLAWLVEPLSAPLVRANPFLDEVIVFERRKAWQRQLSEGKLIAFLREVHAYRRELHARRFDIVFDCQGLLKSGLLAQLSGAPRRIGYAPSREYNHLFLTESVASPAHPTRITQRPLSLLTALGLDPSPRAPVLVIPDAERAHARAFTATHDLADAPYAACCIATSRPQKDWVWSRWGELADLLWEREGLRTLFIGGPERRVDTLRLVESCASHPISAVGHTNILQSAALVQDAALVIGGDTGLTYAGLATGTPTVALYGSTDPTWLAEEPNTAVCFHPMPCSPCHRRPRCQHFDCMQAITVREVADTAAELLERCRNVTAPPAT